MNKQMTRAGLEEERRRSELFSKVKLSEADFKQLRSNIEVPILTTAYIPTIATVNMDFSSCSVQCREYCEFACTRCSYNML
jgi:hypothetical protein